MTPRGLPNQKGLIIRLRETGCVSLTPVANARPPLSGVISETSMLGLLSHRLVLDINNPESEVREKMAAGGLEGGHFLSQFHPLRGCSCCPAKGYQPCHAKPHTA